MCIRIFSIYDNKLILVDKNLIFPDKNIRIEIKSPDKEQFGLTKQYFGEYNLNILWSEIKK